MKKAIILSVTLSVLLLLVIGYKLVHRVEPISPIVNEETIPNETETPDIQEVTGVDEDGNISYATSDGSSSFISDDTVVPEIVDIETLEEMGLRDPADNPANNKSDEQKEVYDNPIIQADSETYIEYLGKTISLKDYYEEIIRMDPEGCIKDGMLERVLAYAPDWCAEHGYTVEDISKEETQAGSQTQQQGQAAQQPVAQQPSNRIEDNSITPAPDPSLIDNSDNTGEIPQWAKDMGLGQPTGGDTTLDWGKWDPSWIQVN